MIEQPTEEVIHRAGCIIRRGGLVAIPTETVYGLGADATNAAACASIFEAKKRPFFDPLIVHICDNAMRDTVAVNIAPAAQKLMDAFWPGPLTVVCEKSSIIPDIVTSGLSTVAVRMPAHPVALAIIRAAGCPIAAPSANPFGYLSPTEAAHVDAQLGSEVDLIIDGGPCAVGVESTIVSVLGDVVTILRPGGISKEDIESVAGRVETISDSGALINAPGLLDSHYAPKTPLLLIDEDEPVPAGANRALLAYRTHDNGEYIRMELLSPKGDLREAAVNLFSALHRLDQCGADIIYAHRVPESGIGAAIMNRLKKASASRNSV